MSPICRIWSKPNREERTLYVFLAMEVCSRCDCLPVVRGFWHFPEPGGANPYRDPGGTPESDRCCHPVSPTEHPDHPAVFVVTDRPKGAHVSSYESAAGQTGSLWSERRRTRPACLPRQQGASGLCRRALGRPRSDY